MTPEIGILVMTAWALGFLHTILGPDHYLPLVAIARSGNWSAKKTIWITAACGAGHVLGSVIIGSVGLLLGTMLMQLQALESYRNVSAAWLLIGFGLAYSIWGIVQAMGNKPHSHLHVQADDTVHSHLHWHDRNQSDVDDRVEVNPAGQGTRPSITPWVLFLIFAFGPCEALIPLLMYPAADANLVAIAAVVLAFAMATVGTMLALVLLINYGLRIARLPDLNRFGHALAGLTILACGVLVNLGL